MRILPLILTVIAALLLMAPASSQDRANPARKKQTEESAKKVKELQKERIATLKQMAEVIDGMFRNQRVAFADVPYAEVLEARLLVLEAELDAAEKESDRITLYKKMVDTLKEFEKIADARMKAARAPQSDFLKVKARRLKAEIELERAKAREAKESK